ncbi:MAG: hypothetical protein N4A74_22710 [Carboxylicivirga sp.]|nr:hypothetical protein [Carboxylicivirga sp.]
MGDLIDRFVTTGAEKEQLKAELMEIRHRHEMEAMKLSLVTKKPTELTEVESIVFSKLSRRGRSTVKSLIINLHYQEYFIPYLKEVLPIT